MFGARFVDKQKRVEAVVGFLRIAPGPRGTLGPTDECEESWMRGDELLHRIRVLASGGSQQLVEVLWRGDGEDRSVDHGAPPFLPVRRRDTDAEAAHAHHCIRGIRIRSGEVESSHHRILAANEDLRPGERRAVAISFERASETDAFGMVAAMAQRRAARRRQPSHDLFWRQPLRREPSGRIRESNGGYADDRSNNYQRPDWKLSWR